MSNDDSNIIIGEKGLYQKIINDKFFGVPIRVLKHHFDLVIGMPVKIFMRKNSILPRHFNGKVGIFCTKTYASIGYHGDKSIKSVFYKECFLVDEKINYLTFKLLYTSKGQLISYQDSKGNEWKREWGVECPYEYENIEKWVWHRVEYARLTCTCEIPLPPSYPTPPNEWLRLLKYTS